jgi:hypothetical protein
MNRRVCRIPLVRIFRKSHKFFDILKENTQC